jgi:hypothetical protein
MPAVIRRALDLEPDLFSQSQHARAWLVVRVDDGFGDRENSVPPQGSVQAAKGADLIRKLAEDSH